MARRQIVLRATELYESFVTFVLDAMPIDDRHRRFVASMAVHGREQLRFAPRDGDVPAEVEEMITHWFGILESWMSDPDAARNDPDAVSTWISEWPAGLVRELLFVGLRSPDGLDQEVYKLGQLLPTEAVISIDIRAGDLDVRLEAPGFTPISLRRRAGTSDGLRLPLDLALGSLAAALQARERGEEIS